MGTRTPAGFPTTLGRRYLTPALSNASALFSDRAAPPVIRSGAVRSRKEPHAVSNDEERHSHVRSDAHPKGDEPQGGENEKDRLGRQGKDDVEPDDPESPAPQAYGEGNFAEVAPHEDDI